MSKQRQVILNIIKEHKDHLSADDIFLLAKKEIPNIALGTVYRNLNILVENNQIRRVSIQGSPDKFDWNLLKHDHLVCAKCGSISDFHIQGIDELIKSKIDSFIAYDIKIDYICDKCKLNKTED